MFELIGAGMEVWAVHRLFAALPARCNKLKYLLWISAVLACFLLTRILPDRYHTTYYLIYYWILGSFLLLDKQSDFKNFIYNWMLIFFLNFPMNAQFSISAICCPRRFPAYRRV